MAEEKKQGAAGQNIGDILKIRRDKLSVLQEAGRTRSSGPDLNSTAPLPGCVRNLTPWRTRRCVWPDA